MQVFENLRQLQHVPGVQIRDSLEEFKVDDFNEESANLDERLPQRELRKRIQPENEHSDSEDEGKGGRRNVISYRTILSRKRIRPCPKKPIVDEYKPKGAIPKVHNCVSQFRLVFI